MKSTASATRPTCSSRWNIPTKPSRNSRRITREDAEDEFVTQEIRLVSQTPGPLQWIVGGFYNHRYSYGVSQEFTPGYSEFLVGGTGAGFRPDALEYYSADYQHLIEKAFFGEISYDIRRTGM